MEQDNLAQMQRGETQEVPEGEALHGVCPRPSPREPQTSRSRLQGFLPWIVKQCGPSFSSLMNSTEVFRREASRARKLPLKKTEMVGRQPSQVCFPGEHFRGLEVSLDLSL